MKYYCIGIKGAGMATLACILFDLGHEVVGYDDYKDYKYTEDGLNKRKIKIYTNNSYILEKDTIVTYSAAFSGEHPEIKRVNNSPAKIMLYHDILGSLSAQFKTICVAGTHGKTTTSMMLKTLLEKKVGCNYFIGDGTGYANKKNELFILESCEYKRHFLAYSPTITILTNIDLEHTECYKDIDDLINTFTTFINKTKDIVIACGDDQNIRKIKTNKEIIFYGFNEDNDVIAKNIKYSEHGSQFDCYINGILFGNFILPLYGSHMILNALSAIYIGYLNNLTVTDIHNELDHFTNAKRRFKENIIGDIVTIDDYAHHPTEIKVTLLSAKQKYPNKELVAVFMPNTYSRTKDFTEDFIESLNIADKAYVTPINSDREIASDYDNISSDAIINKLRNGTLITNETVNQLLEHKNAVICFMSCASIYILKDKYEALL
jgi:UDP-N-acetylmuramate--alanine ligase